MNRLQFVTLVLSVCALLFIASTSISVSAPASAIFDGDDGIPDPPLQVLYSHTADMPGTDPSEPTLIYYSEEWGTDVVLIPQKEKYARFLRIDRWYTPSPAAAEALPYNLLVTGTYDFPGWSRTADVGDRSLYIAGRGANEDIILFVKGRVFVQIVQSPGLHKFGRAYLIRIARKIAAKL